MQTLLLIWMLPTLLRLSDIKSDYYSINSVNSHEVWVVYVELLHGSLDVVPALGNRRIAEETRRTSSLCHFRDPWQCYTVPGHEDEGHEGKGPDKVWYEAKVGASLICDWFWVTRKSALQVAFELVLKGLRQQPVLDASLVNCLSFVRWVTETPWSEA